MRSKFTKSKVKPFGVALASAEITSGKKRNRLIHLALDRAVRSLKRTVEPMLTLYKVQPNRSEEARRTQVRKC